MVLKKKEVKNSTFSASTYAYAQPVLLKLMLTSPNQCFPDVLRIPLPDFQHHMTNTSGK